MAEEVTIVEKTEDSTPHYDETNGVYDPQTDMVQIYDQHVNQDQQAATQAQQVIDPDFLILNCAIKSADIQTKVNMFLNTFGTAMRTLRQNQPEVWKECLESVRKAYQEAPTIDSIIIELVASHAVEYQEALLEGIVSPFSKQLKEFAIENNLLMR